MNWQFNKVILHGSEKNHVFGYNFLELHDFPQKILQAQS